MCVLVCVCVRASVAVCELHCLHFKLNSFKISIPLRASRSLSLRLSVALWRILGPLPLPNPSLLACVGISVVFSCFSCCCWCVVHLLFFFSVIFPPLCCFPIAVAVLLLLLFLFLLASMHFSIMIERHLSLVLLFWFGLVSFYCCSTDIFERLDV